MIENLKKITSLDELKKLGSVGEIILTLEKLVKPLKITAVSYEELLEYITVLQSKWLDLQDNEFFKSEKCKYLFCLTQVDGKRRNEAIGLTDELYDDQDKAKKWYRAIVKTIRPDVNVDDVTKRAFYELKKLYDMLMVSFDEDK